MAQDCVKRPYYCQHCNFKATYEEVVDRHLPECKYVPLQCPNLCGVTFERDFMEDHMKMCRLEEVGCEFSGVGCDGQFRREDQEEHTRQNSQKHLTLTASLAVETKEQLQLKLLEQDKKHKEEEEKLRQKIEKQERNLNAQVIEHREEVVQKLAEQKKMLEELFESKLQCMDQKLLELTKKSNQNEINIKKCCGMISLDRTFEMTNFSAEKAKFTIELINQQGRENTTSTTDIVAWKRPVQGFVPLGAFYRIKIGVWDGFIEHSKLGDFLVNDTLHFNISKVEL